MSKRLLPAAFALCLFVCSFAPASGGELPFPTAEPTPTPAQYGELPFPTEPDPAAAPRSTYPTVLVLTFGGFPVVVVIP